jgi:hypothetical protein
LSVINPNISVDCVIFGYDLKDLNVLLVERTLISESGEEVFSDHTLLGNHIYEEEDIYDAARRILQDLTGFEDIFLEQFHAFADPDRLKKKKDQQWLQSIGHDPDTRVITVGYYALLHCNDVRIHTGNRKVEWVPVNLVDELAFDHNLILQQAMEDLRNKAMLSPIAYQLLPRKFTLSQLQKLYEVIFNIELDKRNFRKKVARMKYLIPLNEKQKGVAHKPAQLYMFSHEVFEMTKKELFDFTI